MQPDDLQRWQSLHLAARRAWGDRFLARRVERAVAGGTEVTGYRDYTTGDDFRTVDWNLCARHDELRSREYRGSEDRSTYFLLDCSASMGVVAGQGGASKFSYAVQLAGALAFLSVANLDRVALLTCADRIVAETAVVRGRRSLSDIQRFLAEATTQEATTNLRAAVEAFVKRPQRRGLVVLVSDLLDPAGFQSALDLLREHRYEPYVVQLFLPEEAEPPLFGKVQLTDAETTESSRFTIDADDLANYQVVFDEFLTSLSAYCVQWRLNYTQASTAVPVETLLQRMIDSSVRGRRQMAEV